LIVVLSVLPQFTDSGYSFGIVRLVLLATKQESPLRGNHPPTTGI